MSAERARVRQQHQIARRDAEVSGQARAFAADRVLDHLDHDLLALTDQFSDGRRRGSQSLGCVAVLRHAHQVVRVQESGALETDLDERCLHAGHDSRYAALVDVADVATSTGAFDVDLLQHAVLDKRYTRLSRGDVDQDFFGHGKL
jgi:hypothetical protein